MAAALSQDLRKRLVGEVEQGRSARQAAARFAVSASAAIKLVRRVRETGSTEPGKIGGHRQATAGRPRGRAARTGGHAEGHYPGRDQGCADRTRDPAWLADDNLVDAASSRADTQKKRCTPPSKSGRTWLSIAGSGSVTWMQLHWCLSMRPGPAPAWCDTTAGIRAGNAWSMPRRMGIGTPRPLWRDFAPLVLLLRSYLMDR